MGDSTPIKGFEKAEAYARARSANLRASDKRFNGTVQIGMDDGSFFSWDSAFIEIKEIAGERWIMVFTEHYGHHVFAEEDVLFHKSYAKPVFIK